MSIGRDRSSFRTEVHEIIFEADTTLGKAFDVFLIIAIILSVVVVMLDSVSSIKSEYGLTLYYLEWFFTILFTIEYILRLYCVLKPLKYATSFFGIVDLLAILPTYIALFIPGSQYFLVVRVLRLLRIFRVLKLVQFIGESQLLFDALLASRRKITIFTFFVMTIVIILGSLMYVVEGIEYGFTSIPRSMYWAIVTLTTVGYGDISPQTPIGQLIATVVMLLGFSIIAIPTGILTVEISQAYRKRTSTQVCQNCLLADHENDANFCRGCGLSLDD